MTFLERMAESSRARVIAAREKESDAALERRALATPAPPRLVLNGFDVIAELKLRSPAAGGLASGDFDKGAQLTSYGQAGAAAVSVLTEPTEFKGELGDLTEAAQLLASFSRPAMRKDFLTDPYQVLEARAAGAGGVLVIVTMLDDATVRALTERARSLGLFVLLEAFDRADLERLAPFDVPPDGGPLVLAGVNCRDLRDLNVRFSRFAELARYLPQHLPTVAESGIGNADDIRHVASAGYRLALIGSSLMRAQNPGSALAALIAAGRTTAAKRH
jgi:indole-3-glycerol phosphate synthase